MVRKSVVWLLLVAAYTVTTWGTPWLWAELGLRARGAAVEPELEYGEGPEWIASAVPVVECSDAGQAPRLSPPPGVLVAGIVGSVDPCAGSR